MLSSLARADAMAEGSKVGIGGWISTKHSLAWFAEAYTMEEIRAFWPFLTKEAQRYIACFETLAQLALAMTAKAHHGHSRMNICLPTESDNTPTEGGINKLFTTSWPLSEFLGLIASWSPANDLYNSLHQQHRRPPGRPKTHTWPRLSRPNLAAYESAKGCLQPASFLHACPSSACASPALRTEDRPRWGTTDMSLFDRCFCP